MRRSLLSAILLLVASACGEGDDGIGTPADAGGIEPADGGPSQEDSGVVAPDSGPPMCVELTVFGDVDGDQFGVATATLSACLLPGEEQPGYSRQAGDCKETDPWANPAATEICGDHYDDNCDEADEPCPTTNEAALDVPEWDCLSSPIPANVYAYALFADGATYFQPNGCFVFFEGLANEFYVQRVNLSPASTDATCTSGYGCVCPTSPSYDRRLYAVTKSETVDPCTELTIINHGGEMQAASNDCRKFLYQLHWPTMPPPPYSFVAGSLDTLGRRLELFPTAEVVCAWTTSAIPFASLVSAPIQKNTGFVKK